MTRKISIVIPAYNAQESIATLLEALTNQDYPADAYEILVVDNRSTDQTATIVGDWQERYPQRIRLLHENDVQDSDAARNRGIGAAQGEILAFTDADCVPSPNWLSAIVAGLQRHGASYGAGRIQFTFQSKPPNLYEYYDSGTYLKQQYYIETKGCAATANFFAHRQLFEEYGLFLTELPSGSDHEFGQRLYKRGERLVYLPAALVQHPARATWRAVQQKELRIAAGQQNAIRFGLRTFYPRAEARVVLKTMRHGSSPHSDDWPQPPTRWIWWQMMGMRTFFLWQRWWLCRQAASKVS